MGGLTIRWNRKDAWVGVLDILGFKDRIRRADQEFPRFLLTSQLDDLLGKLDSDVTQHGHLKCMVFSDTIAIFAPDLEAGWYGWFCHQCEILIRKSIAIKLPLRGAISVGTAFTSDSPPIIIGPSFVEAHEYCEDQKWIGLLLTPSATKRIRELGLEPFHHDFVSDEIPLKCLPADNVLAYRLHNGMSRQESELLSPLEEMKHFAADNDKEKYDKTIAFIKKHYRFIGR